MATALSRWNERKTQRRGLALYTFLEPTIRPFNSPERSANVLLARIDELRRRLQARHPSHLAEMTGAIYRPETPDSGVFLIPVWGQDTILTYPEFEASDALNDKALGTVTQALLLYYFLTADGTSDSGQWISFSDLPDGRFYNQAFQGYTGAEIVKHFKSDREAFERAAQKLAGFHTPIGDAAYTFKLFPHFPMVTVFWQGDEDFPSTLQILFAASAHHYLPTDACAIAGSILTRRLLTASS